MTDDLVKRLREVGHDYDFHENALIYMAADLIEAQAAEIERLKREVMLQMGWKTKAQNEVDELEAALDNIANESSDTWARDAARAALGDTQ